jgi:hypothetical protein
MHAAAVPLSTLRERSCNQQASRPGLDCVSAQVCVAPAEAISQSAHCTTAVCNVTRYQDHGSGARQRCCAHRHRSRLNHAAVMRKPKLECIRPAHSANRTSSSNAIK